MTIGPGNLPDIAETGFFNLCQRFIAQANFPGTALGIYGQKLIGFFFFRLGEQAKRQAKEQEKKHFFHGITSTKKSNEFLLSSIEKIKQNSNKKGENWKKNKTLRKF